jgi:hypothetical protein
MNKYKTLPEFTQAVNDLAREDAAKINDLNFKPVHIDFPASMLEYDFRDGLTPRQTLTRINNESKRENQFEAMCS